MRLSAISRLRLRDVLLLRVERDVDESLDTFEANRAEVAQQLAGVTNIPVIILDSTQTLDSISESDMARAGWIKVGGQPPLATPLPLTEPLSTG